ncbi:MOSC domain-containing protein [Nocardioides sp. BP30]|uniref:MOSC domain-containing protein n=1 Tax=Nocardioides sp. BP30 TaxID=3036374 RepID=UPI0024683397|nr:MOSC domain-containing protein [Nocardioides sp. BP30]WGL53921.1 MOSC domain-containing protein [Nocardioides sp. BP30]
MPDPTVLRAGFSAVKGTRHLSLERVVLDPHGAVGDRRLCLVDAPARRVLRTVQHPALTAVDASDRDGVLRIALPDGRSAVATPHPTGERLICEYWGRPAELALLDGPHAALLSDHLGRPVTLAAAPPRAVVYGAGVSVVTRASLAELAARTGTRMDPARFRATFVIDSAEGPGAEDGWEGRELRLGSAVVRVGAGIGRCAVIDVDPRTGRREGRLLRTLSAYRPRNADGEPCFGVYAEVVVPGVVTVASANPSQGLP